MRSITLLQLKEEPIRLEEVAREHSVHYMSATAALGDGGEYIGAETDLNLFTVQKEDIATMPSQMPGASLLPRGEFHLGEMVVRFCEGKILRREKFMFRLLTSCL
jgi:DNA damage-binding protein 1